MSKRLIGATLVFCAAAGITAWGWDHAQSGFTDDSTFGNSEFAGEDAGDDTPAPASEQTGDERPLTPLAETRRAPRGRPAPHLTEAQDDANIRAIRAQTVAMFAEYNARHAPAYAERFLSNAEYEMDTGEVLIGRQAIQDHFEKLFAEYPQGKSHSHESNIRTVSLNMAIEEGIVAITHTDEDEESVTPYVAVWTFVNGHWSLASMRELTGDEGEYNAHDHLQDLAWIVGEWVDESEEAIVTTSCRWSEDSNFLLQDFTVHVMGVPEISGTQRIGYDPLTHTLRSWVFDSQGGFGESLWNWDGEKWVIRSSAVRHDGHIAASINFIIPDTEDAYFWESSHRMTNNEALPDLRVKIVRRAPPPESDASGE